MKNFGIVFGVITATVIGGAVVLDQTMDKEPAPPTKTVSQSTTPATNGANGSSTENQAVADAGAKIESTPRVEEAAPAPSRPERVASAIPPAPPVRSAPRTSVSPKAPEPAAIEPLATSPAPSAPVESTPPSNPASSPATSDQPPSSPSEAPAKDGQA